MPTWVLGGGLWAAYAFYLCPLSVGFMNKIAAVVAIVVGLQCSSPFNSSYLQASESFIGSALPFASPLAASSPGELLPAVHDLLATSRESDRDFDAFVLNSLLGNPDYQVLETVLSKSLLQVEISNAIDAVAVSAGVKYRPEGDQNTSVSEVGGYLNLQKSLYDFGRVKHRVVAATAEVEAVAFDNLAKVNELKAQLSEQYFNLIKVDADIRHRSEQARYLAEVIDHLKARSQGGLGSSLDYELLNDEGETLRLEIQLKQLEVDKLRAIFANNYAVIPTQLFVPSRFLPELYQGEAWTDKLFLQSVALRLLDQRLASVRSLKKSAQSDHYPTLALNMAYVESNLAYDLFTTVDLNLPLYNGGKTQLGIAEKELEITELLLQIQSERKRVKDQARGLLYDYTHAAQRFTVYDELVRSKVRLMDVMQERMRRTQGQLQDLYQIKKGMADARVQRDRALIDALYFAYLSRLLIGA